MPTRDCPDCGSPLGRKAIKCRCGWAAPRSATTITASEDPLRLCCEWISNGERCRYMGAHSDGTLGGGPWYCRLHRNCHDQAVGAQIVSNSLADVPHVDYSYAARRAAFLARPDTPPSNSPLVASIRAAYRQSQAYRDKHLSEGRIAGFLPAPDRQPGED